MDLNPLAVDLCKLALWLEGHWTGKPLSFLDHRIKCGNSLIGVLDPKVLEEGVLDDAFKPVTGDDKEVVKAFKKRNRDERRGQPSLPFDAAGHVHDYATEYHKLAEIAEETPSGVRAKANAYQTWHGRKDWWHDWTACNMWTTAFFALLTRFDDATVPTHERLLKFVQRRDSQPQMAAAANALAEQLRFFHWRLEFPEVFEKTGFDVVLGNPPWERIKLQEEEHWVDDPYISKAPNKAARSSRINEYRLSRDPSKQDRVAKFDLIKHASDAEGKFVRESKRFPLTGVGDVNTASLFAELSRSLIQGDGRAGLIVPTGICTDATTKEFFGDLVERCSLKSYFGFKNERFLFAPPVEHYVTFGLLTMLGAQVRAEQMEFCWSVYSVEEMHDAGRRIFLTSQQIISVNPNTKTCPIFRTSADATLTLKIHGQIPVLWNEAKGENAWSVYCIRLVHLSDHAEYIRYLWESPVSRNTDEQPLYEAKLFQSYDHRFATFEGTGKQDQIDGRPRPLSSEEKCNPTLVMTPRYFVREQLVTELFSKYPEYKRQWLLVWRDVARATDERTCISTAIPRVPASVKCPALGTGPEFNTALLLANLNSLVLDYCVRQKIGGASLSFFVLKQLPVLAPAAYEGSDHAFILLRVLQLTYTAHDLKGFAREFDHEDPPFTWDESRRSSLRAELDAYYAHLYSLTRDELRYILDPKEVFGEDFPSETFRVLKEREEKEFGEYRTRRLVLEAFDKLAESPRFKDEMPKRVSAFEVPTRANAATEGRN